MAKLLKLRRGTTSQHSSFTGAEGEVTIDTDKDVPVVHDGSTAGGHPVAAEDMSNVSSSAIAGRLSNDSIAVSKIAAGTLPSDVKIQDANVSGNLTIESADIVDGTIVNADVNASAAITGSKLADNSISLAKLEHGTSSNNGKFLRANNGADPSFETVNTDLVADTSPQLGGNLDLNSNTINGTGNISISGNLAGNALTLNNNNLIINGTQPNISFVDSDGNPDYQIKINGGVFDIRDSTNDTSKFQIASGELAAQAKLNCQAGLDTDGDVVFNSSTTNVGVTFDASTSTLNMSDSQALSFGDHSTTGDYNLSYVNGSDFNIVGQSGGSGDLVLGTFASGTTTKNLVSKRSNNAIELYFGGNKKAETVTGGFTVTGTCTATAFAGDGSALTGIDAFPSGTKMLFQQTSAPTGWTKVTSGVDNKALRVVSGTAGSGGSNAFSNTLASRGITANAGNTTAGGNVSVANSTAGGNVSVANATPGGNVSVSIANASTGGTVNSHTLSTNEMPSHSHGISSHNSRAGSGGLASGSTGQNRNTNSAGGSGGHSHGFTGGSHNHNANASFSGSAHNHNATFSGSAHNHNASFSGSAHNHSISVTNLDMAVQYLDVIIASKD